MCVQFVKQFGINNFDIFSLVTNLIYILIIEGGKSGSQTIVPILIMISVFNLGLLNIIYFCPKISTF
jgi:hypothetical protein